MRYKVRAFYGVDEPANGKRRGECAIETMYFDRASFEAALMRFMTRQDIGWIDITDLDSDTTEREYMR